MTAPSAATVHMSLAEVRALARSTLLAVGLSADHAAAVAETMVAGERDGCASHGIYRLLIAVNSVRRGTVVTDAVPAITEPAPALVRVDGQGGFAQLAFELGMPLLAAKARTHGIAAMALTNVVHFAALWPEMEALAAGCEGAALALIERSLHMAASQLNTAPRLYLHGGGAQALRVHLPAHVWAADAVLLGLARWHALRIA